MWQQTRDATTFLQSEGVSSLSFVQLGYIKKDPWRTHFKDQKYCLENAYFKTN